MPSRRERIPEQSSMAYIRRHIDRMKAIAHPGDNEHRATLNGQQSLRPTSDPSPRDSLVDCLASPTTTKPKPKRRAPKSFLNLSPEVRLLIYIAVKRARDRANAANSASTIRFVHDDTPFRPVSFLAQTVRRSSELLNLSLTCSTVLDEALPLMYEDLTFSFTKLTDAAKLRRLTPLRRWPCMTGFRGDLVQHMEVAFCPERPYSGLAVYCKALMDSVDWGARLHSLTIHVGAHHGLIDTRQAWECHSREVWSQTDRIARFWLRIRFEGQIKILGGCPCLSGDESDDGAGRAVRYAEELEAYRHKRLVQRKERARFLEHLRSMEQIDLVDAVEETEGLKGQ